MADFSKTNNSFQLKTCGDIRRFMNAADTSNVAGIDDNPDLNPHFGHPYHHHYPPNACSSYTWMGYPHHFGHRRPGAFGAFGLRGRRNRRGRSNRGQDGSDLEVQNGTSSRTASPGGQHTDAEHVKDNTERGRRRGPGKFSRRFGHTREGRGHHGWRESRPFPFPARFMRPPEVFDMKALVETLLATPLVQSPLMPWVQQAVHAQRQGEIAVDDEIADPFLPPVDIFSTDTAYVLHIELPGVKKDDVGLHWDVDNRELKIAGVIYRQGDESFLQTLKSSERNVGTFERSIKLPPGEDEKEEVDGEGINAKLDDGILVVKVPKVEREWTEIKKVDIE